MGEMYRAELLAPAGSLSVCKAAVFAGADAVYMGGQKYSARAFAKSSFRRRMNFSWQSSFVISTGSSSL